MQNVTIWLERIWTYKNADEKDHTFSWRRKYVQKRTKRTKIGYCVNPYLELYFSNITLAPALAVQLFSGLVKTQLLCDTANTCCATFMTCTATFHL